MLSILQNTHVVLAATSYLDLYYVNNYIIIIHSIYSLMRFPYKSIQTAYYYKENPPSTHLEAKTSRIYRKNALPKANPR